MILHPDVQAKVQEELDRVVGKERLPGLAEYVPEGSSLRINVTVLNGVS